MPWLLLDLLTEGLDPLLTEGVPDGRDPRHDLLLVPILRDGRPGDPGDRLGIWSPNRAEWVLVQYATAKAGIVLVNINPAYRTSELEYALRQSGCRWLIAAPAFKTSDYAAMIESVRGDLPELERVVLLGTDDWEALAAKGASPQRCLWASTSTKNPDYRDVLYVEELIARDTVNTMPLETIEAFADHGEVRGQTATEGLDRAHRLWSDLAALGIDEDDIGDRLDREGVEKFTDSYNGAVEAIEAKVRKLGG
jgi:transaldolase